MFFCVLDFCQLDFLLSAFPKNILIDYSHRYNRFTDG